jgi:hypothetical protein
MGRRGVIRDNDLLARMMPWRVAAAWGNPDSTLERSDILGSLMTARSLLGMLTVGAVSIETGSQNAYGVLSETWVKTLYNVVLAGCLLPVSMVLVLALTKSGYRKDLRWWPVLGRVGLMIGTAWIPLFGILDLMIQIVVPAIQNVPRGSMTAGLAALTMWVSGGVIIFLAVRGHLSRVVTVIAAVVIGPFLGVFLFSLLLWSPLLIWLAYFSCVAFWASRTCCWVGLFHPLLTPPLSAAIVTTFTVVSLVNADTEGVPVTLWLWLTFGGLASTLALATAEWVQLRRQGYRFLYGPEPHRLTTAARPAPALNGATETETETREGAPGADTPSDLRARRDSNPQPSDP